MPQLLQSLLRQTASLLLYQSVLRCDIGQAFVNLLQTLGQPDEPSLNCLRAYGQWFQALAATQQTWQEYLIHQVLQTENPFSQLAQRTNWADLPQPLIAAARHDLHLLQALYQCRDRHLSLWVQQAAAVPEPLPTWDADQIQHLLEKTDKPEIWLKLQHSPDWAAEVESLAAHYRQFGVGLFAMYRALRWQAGQLMGIPHPDPVRLTSLVGYEAQKAALMQNTKALLSGYTALHVLLYGSRGTGKSSLVKALLQEFGERGLRLIEVPKAELQALPEIVEQLRYAPQKFVIFVDDLSFEEDDDAYKALKVVLEGNLTARPQNVVVYATSNRRHLIREFFGDRPRPSDADEVHAWDTVQEKLSFSDRFGLTLTFEPANQTTYLQMVQHLAAEAAIAIDAKDLEYLALQWATRHNGRSGRTARQFVDFLQAEADRSIAKTQTN